jgi:hypothetical protein
VASLDHHYTDIATEKYGSQLYTGLSNEGAYCNVTYTLNLGHAGVSLYYTQLVLLQAAGQVGLDVPMLDLPEVLPGAPIATGLQAGDVVFTITNDDSPHLGVVAAILATDGSGRPTLLDLIDSSYPLVSGSEFHDPIEPDVTSHQIIGRHKIVPVDSYQLWVE